MTRFCSFDGCGKALTSHSARSLCSGHYQQWQRGEALVPLQPRNTLVPWLLAHIEYNGDDCLKWPGMRGIRSYSQLAGQYGITGGTVGKIIRGERWGHV